MSSPPPDWTSPGIPAAAGWGVAPRWRGLFDRNVYDSPAACFLANRTCEQLLVREPLPYHCRPIAQPHVQPADTADLHDGLCDDAHARADGDDDRTGSASGSGQGDEGCCGDAPGVSRRDGHTGHASHLLVADKHADPSTDSDLSDMRDADSRSLLRQGSST